MEDFALRRFAWRSISLTTAALLVAMWVEPAGAIVVCLDAGHGNNTGTYGQQYPCGSPGGTWDCYEDDMALDIAQNYIPSYMNVFGMNLVQTRSTSTENPSHSARIQLAYDAHALVFVSIHENGCNSTSTSYVMYEKDGAQLANYLWPYSIDLATKVAAGLCQTYASTHAGMECTHALDAKDVGRSHITVLYMAQMPSILGEPVCLDSPNGHLLCSGSHAHSTACEMTVNAEEANQARGYVEGINRYFQIGTPQGDFYLDPYPDGNAAGKVHVHFSERQKTRDVTYVVERADQYWGPWTLRRAFASHDPAYLIDSNESEDSYQFDEDLPYSRWYFYRVTVSGTTESYVNGVMPTGMPSPVLPAPPTGLDAQGAEQPDGTGQTTLTWNASVGGASGYYVFRSWDPDMEALGAVYIGTTTGTTFVDPALPLGVTAYYRVSSYAAGGESEMSAADSVFVQRTVGVGDVNPIEYTRLAGVWPNPVEERAIVGLELAKQSRVDVQLFDVAGRSVARVFEGNLPRGRHEVAWDRRNRRAVGAGVYFLTARVDGKVIGRRAVVVVH